ncbi:type II toxin-antitoxin system VapC family toxin [Candidatus Bipolaricaulota sp. J31]
MRNPLPPREAWDQVKAYLDEFIVLYPDEATFAKLDELVRTYMIRHQDIFDALIVALMLQHGVKGIYTANARDFARFREIEVLPWP